MLSELSDKNVNVRNVAEKALENERLLSELLEGLNLELHEAILSSI